MFIDQDVQKVKAKYPAAENIDKAMPMIMPTIAPLKLPSNLPISVVGMTHDAASETQTGAWSMREINRRNQTLTAAIVVTISKSQMENFMGKFDQFGRLAMPFQTRRHQHLSLVY